MRSPVVPAVVGALLLSAGCARTEKPAEEQAAAPASAPAAAAPNLVHVTAGDFSFTAPDTLPSGVTTFHLMNEGKQLHHLVLVKMPLAELKKADMNAPPPPDLVVLGGPNVAPPAGTAEGTVDLSPGTYTLICFIPGPDGKPHFMNGMMKELTVTSGTSTAVMPAGDITIKLVDYNFEITGPLTAGHHIVRIENAGPQMHEMVFVKLEPGKSAEDFARWSEKMAGPPPGSPINGASPMTTGVVNTVAVDLTAGDYALVCFVMDVKDKKPHVAHGMVRQFTVN